MSIHYAETRFGFEYGAAKIERCCSDEKFGWVIVIVKTPKHNLQVYVTKTGKVRVHDKGEWLPKLKANKKGKRT